MFPIRQNMLDWLKDGGESEIVNGRAVKRDASFYASDQVELISANFDQFSVAKTQKMALKLDKEKISTIG